MSRISPTTPRVQESPTPFFPLFFFSIILHAWCTLGTTYNSSVREGFIFEWIYYYDECRPMAAYNIFEWFIFY